MLSNGEKVPPVDIEAAIVHDPLVEQVMLLGEGKSYLSVMAVLNGEHWKKLAAELGVDPDDPKSVSGKKAEDAVLARIAEQLRAFPGYARIRRATLTLEPWTVENGMLTPTMKLKRGKVMEKFHEEIDQMYIGH